MNCTDCWTEPVTDPRFTVCDECLHRSFVHEVFPEPQIYKTISTERMKGRIVTQWWILGYSASCDRCGVADQDFFWNIAGSFDRLCGGCVDECLATEGYGDKDWKAWLLERCPEEWYVSLPTDVLGPCRACSGKGTCSLIFPGSEQHTCLCCCGSGKVIQRAAKAKEAS